MPPFALNAELQTLPLSGLQASNLAMHALERCFRQAYCDSAQARHVFAIFVDTAIYESKLLQHTCSTPCLMPPFVFAAQWPSS